MHSSGQAVGRLVGQLDDIRLVLELADGADRPEDLLLHNLHVRANIAKDGRLDKVPLVAVALSANFDGGALLLAGLDVAHDAVVLELADLGSLECFLREGIADLVLLAALLESLQELVVDALLNVDTGTGAAALAVVVVDAKVDPVDGLLNVGIVEDNVGRLTAELEGHLLQVGGSGSLHDGAADDSGASEGNLVNVHVGGNGSTGDLAETADQVEDTGREAGLLDKLGEDEG